jgi:hypothetical protein
MIEHLESRIAPATFMVTTLADTGDGSLRKALENANSGAGKDTIKFAKTVRGTISIASELLITGDLNLVGPGAGLLTIDAGGGNVLTIDDGTSAVKTVTISGLTLTHGAGTALRAPIQVMENLALKSSVISNMDTASGDNGALTKAGGTKLELNATQFINCTGEGAVTVLAGSAVLTKAQFFNNKGTTGGALRFASPNGGLTVTGSTFFGNSAGIGGALHLTLSAGFAANLLSSNFSVNAATSTTAGEGGGAVFVDAVGAYLQDKNTFTGNQAAKLGGAILIADAANATLKRDSFFGNQAGDSGGGLAVAGDGAPMKLAVQSARLEGNSAVNFGGAIFFRGDGEMDSAPTKTTLTVLATILTRNRAGQDGGGLQVDDDAGSTRTTRIDLKTSTFTGNEAGHDGGGAVLRTSADVYLATDKFLQNHAANGGGGLVLDTLGDFTDLTAINFTQNYAAFGGGLAAVADGGATIDRSVFLQNYATDPLGTGGGAMNVALSDLQIVVSGTKITDNFSASVAGGIRKFNDLDVLLFPGNTIRNNIP